MEDTIEPCRTLRSGPSKPQGRSAGGKDRGGDDDDDDDDDDVNMMHHLGQRCMLSIVSALQIQISVA